MKKFLALIVISLFLVATPLKTLALSFGEAMAQNGKKPMIVLFYADWASGYKECQKQMRILKKTFGNTFNYVELDIASDDMMEYNQRYSLTPNLPYIKMYKSNGKVTRYFDTSCSMDASCMIPKVKMFIH